MADDVTVPQQTPAPSTAGEATAPTVEELQAQLAERDRALQEREHDLKVYKDTLAALGSERQPVRREEPASSARPVPQNDADYAKELAQETGYPVEQIAPYIPVIRGVLRRDAAPVMNVLGGMANRMVDLETRLTVQDYKEIEQEIGKVQREYQSRGTYLHPRDAAEIARARKAPEIERRRAEEAQRQQREAHLAAETNEPTAGSVQKAGPSPIKKQPPPKTRAEIMKLPPAERDKALEDALNQVEF